MKKKIVHTTKALVIAQHNASFLRCCLLIVLLCGYAIHSFSQREPIPCRGPGSTPTTAYLLCDKGSFIQDWPLQCLGGFVKIPNSCRSTPLNPPEDTQYEVFSPVYYKFTCYVSGTFGFVIRPIAPEVNLDWQLYDITNKHPDALRVTTEHLIAGNWSTIAGSTGTEDPGLPFVICKPHSGGASLSAYSAMPDIIAGHQYLLLVANPIHYKENFRMTIDGGTASIRDPLMPHLDKVKAECIGDEITIKVNKAINCASLTASGSEFSILPAGPAVISAKVLNCTSNTDFTELTLKLSSRLAAGNYKLVINKGSDNNTLLDFCNTPIPDNEELPFDFVVPVPILADSVAKPDCVPDSIKLYFPKRISCSSISGNGTDFLITGPEAVSVKSASGKCINGKTDYVTIKFNSPIRTKGNYTLTLKPGDDGTVIVDECGEESPPQNISFYVADTVNADFTYNMLLGCQRDTLTFSHSGANDVNKWQWKFNDKIITTQNHRIIWPAKSDNEVELIVTNGSCKDTAAISIKLDNEVKAAFEMPSFICPEDKLEVVNRTEGVVDSWKWTFDIAAASDLKQPPPFLMPSFNREAYYTVKLVAFNNTIGCSDSTKKTLTVLDNCSGSVPSAFTPNNDGLNDFFWPHNALKSDNYEFKIYNRQGQLVFQTRNWQAKWDGRVKGEMQNTGVYVWMLQYTDRDTKSPVFKKGTVALIR